MVGVSPHFDSKFVLGTSKLNLAEVLGINGLISDKNTSFWPLAVDTGPLSSLTECLENKLEG
jgi:hypothetical protein